MTAATWHRVTKANPCPICQKSDWCTISTDGASCCMRVESPITMKNGGWLHRGDKKAPSLAIPRQVVSKPPKTFIDFDRLLASWKVGHYTLESYARVLGVTWESLKYLGACHTPEHRAWAFPMCDGTGKVIGIRLRNNEGKKWAVKGSRNGIFIPRTTPQDTVWICEGPTDTAAALSMGLYAVGRPSCNCGGPEIAQHCKRIGIRKAVIVADNDAPGLRGAEKIANELKMSSVVICPPAKDIREFYRNGGSAEELQFMVSQNVWRIKLCQ